MFATVESLTSGAVTGILEAVFVAIISYFLLRSDYKEEWILIRKSLAIGTVVFGIKVILFTLPYLKF